MKRILVRTLLGLITATCWALPLHAYDPNNRTEYLAKIKEAKAYYKEKCEKVAGIRIYKTVPDVERLLLMKVRPNRTDRELADPMWPGAAFGGEAYGDGYITSFLGHEKRPEGSTERGHITTGQPVNNVPGTRWDFLPGYRWVEVIDEKDGQRYRYNLEFKEVTHVSSITIGGDGKPFTVKENVLEKVLSTSKNTPRYAVTFEDHVIPDERALWVASSMVKVLDLQTDEVLGEMLVYAISYIHSPTHSMPWLNHSECGIPFGRSGTATRHFVDQILIPKRGK